jgi:hypothetical protein
MAQPATTSGALEFAEAVVTNDAKFLEHSYDVDAAFMLFELHERGIHAVCPDTDAAGVTKVRFLQPLAAGEQTSEPTMSNASYVLIRLGPE